MKPDVAMACTELARRMREELLSELTGFRANVAAMGAAMLDMVAEQWDGAAARLVAENRALRDVLRLGGEAAEGEDEDLRISALTATNDVLRERLILLHTRVEQTKGDEARRIEDAIWAFLRDSIAARRIGSANF